LPKRARASHRARLYGSRQACILLTGRGGKEMQRFFA
jgi:hypothetical protein